MSLDPRRVLAVPLLVRSDRLLPRVPVPRDEDLLLVGVSVLEERAGPQAALLVVLHLLQLEEERQDSP